MTNSTTTEAFITVKLVSYPILAWLFAYTGIKLELGLILGVLLLLDVATGILRVWATEPQKLSTRLGITGVLSKLMLVLIPIVLALVAKGVGMDFVLLLDIAFAILIGYEGWSILGNIQQVRTKDVTLNEYDAVSLLIKELQTVIQNALLSISKNINRKGQD